MISHGKEIKVFTGNSNPALAEDICAQLYKSLGNASVSQFADGECSISVFEPVRGKDVFIVQSTCNHVNDNLMELLIMIDAMRRASAGRIWGHGSSPLSRTSVTPARTERQRAVTPYPQSLLQTSLLPQALTECSRWIFTPHRYRAFLTFLSITSWAATFSCAIL